MLPLLLGLSLLTGFAASERPSVSAAYCTDAVIDRSEDSAATDRTDRALPEYAGTDTPAALLSLRTRFAPNFRPATVFMATGMCGIAGRPLPGDYPTAHICKPTHFRDSYRYYIYMLERMRI
ncbi:hypothetical protein [Alistipes sp.]|uniref:hypothetical protein n=1 Tax=Alistipes sp. TaxID=1872444 RepID=UPI003AB7BEC2